MLFISCILQYLLDILEDICYILGMNKQGNMKMKLARIEKNLTQQDLADRVSVTRQTIGLIEKGNYNPTLNLCINIAKALDRTLDQLFWEVDQDEYETLQTG
jgi:putative transcriptional regulator